MTLETTLRLLLGALLLPAWAAPAAGDTTPEAQKWLEKVVSHYDGGPFEVGYTIELDMSALGQPFAGTLSGSYTRADETHSRMELEMELAGLPGTTEPTRMKILNVADGTTLWTEMDNPALGGRQVTKVALADAAKLGQAMGGFSPTSMDPVAQLETLTRTMDFEVLEVKGGRVTLRGLITDATRAENELLGNAAIDAFLFVLDERTGFPIEVRAEGESPFVTMRFEDFGRIDAKSLADGLFEYSPPEGAAVMDLGAMLE